MRDRAGVRGVRAGPHAAGDVAPRQQRVRAGAARRRGVAVVRRRPPAGLPDARRRHRAVRRGQVPRARRRRPQASARAGLSGRRV